MMTKMGETAKKTTNVITPVIAKELKIFPT